VPWLSFDSGSAAQVGRNDSQIEPLPARCRNLTDRHQEHNRGARDHALRRHGRRAGVDLVIFARYSRRKLAWRSPSGSAITSHEATMTTFDKREDGFEKKFAHDEELKFKAMARRNKMLGLWAADKLGLTGDEAQAYAKEVVLADFEEAGDHDVFRKIRKDFDAKGVAQSDHQIRRTMDELLEQAVAQIKSGS